MKKIRKASMIGICEYCGQVYGKGHPKQRWCHKHKACEADRKYMVDVRRTHIAKKWARILKRERKIKKERGERFEPKVIKDSRVDGSNWTPVRRAKCVKCKRYQVRVNRFGICYQCYEYINRYYSQAGMFASVDNSDYVDLSEIMEVAV